MSPGIRPRTAGAAPSVPSDHSCPPARRAWLHHTADHCPKCLRHELSAAEKFDQPDQPTTSNHAEAKLGVRAERGAVRGGVDERRERPRSRASESGQGPATGPPVRKDPGAERAMDPRSGAVGMRPPRNVPAQARRSRAPLSRMPHSKAGSSGAPLSAIPTLWPTELGTARAAPNSPMEDG